MLFFKTLNYIFSKIKESIIAKCMYVHLFCLNDFSGWVYLYNLHIGAYLYLLYVLYLNFIKFVHAHLRHGIYAFCGLYHITQVPVLNCWYMYMDRTGCVVWWIFLCIYTRYTVCCYIAVTFKIFISNISFMAINSQCHIREYINGCRCCILINNP